MPEGPEVHTIADWLHNHLIGLTLTNLVTSDKSRYAKRNLSGRDILDQYLPLKFVDIIAKGKKIVFMLESTRGSVFFISSLGMEGKWTYDAGNHSDLWFELEDSPCIYFNDSRHFGTLEIFFSSEVLINRMDKIGPDLISDEISDELWLHKIHNKRIKNKKIGIFLMEQNHFSGIGNYLRAEILYAARISPHRPIGSLSDEEALSIFDQARIIIDASYQAQGATLHSYLKPDGGKGTFKVVVYNKTVDPLGNPVISEDLGDKRTMHWVPAVQI